MKTVFDEELEFITPAFLAGANQNVPEVRVPSIRGELRWWFRVLGGTRDEENVLFGAVHGSVLASAVVLRVNNVVPVFGPEITFSPMSDKGYLYYFAKVSGNKDGVHRTQASHYFAPGTKFRLEVYLRRVIDKDALDRLQSALLAFTTFGSLGLRATRGCGALSRKRGISLDDLKRLVEDCGAQRVYVRKIDNETYDNTTGEKCQTALGGFLRALRKNNHISGKCRSALGFSEGSIARAASALRLRPVMVDGKFLPIVIYTDAACLQGSIEDLIMRETKSI